MSVTVLDRPVGPYGFGLMGMTWRPTPTPHDQAFAAMRAALSGGANFWNGGEFYGPPDNNSLTLLRAYFDRYPEDADQVLLSIKGAVVDGHTPTGTPEGVRASVENCLRMLGPRKKLDIFECARKDPHTDIEVTVKALGELVKEGKIGGIALSEVGAATIRRAAAVHRIAAVEVEVSLFEDNVFSNGVAAACAEHGIPIVAYSPLGRGMLTGQIRRAEDIPEGDMRRRFPRYSPENFPKNMELVAKVEALAKQRGITPGQLALAWVAGRSAKPGMPRFIPIPGATSAARVEENTKVVELTAGEEAEIDKILQSFVPAGHRYPEAAQALLDG